jgi:radical SAM-linked protein
MTRLLGDRRVSISLPSMRPGTFSTTVARLIASTKRTGLTFAPEAGSDRLRRVINKDTDEGELFATIETAFKAGWDAVKLYFMIGLPTETDDDASAMVSMVRSVESICRGYGRRKRITVSLSPFVPRPHTPFQWQAQQRPEEALSRLAYIRKSLPDRRVKLKWRDPYMAHLEGLLARGSRDIGRVILRAWRAGSRFDSWTDRFDYDRWQGAFDGEGLSTQDAFAERDPGRVLPWEHIDGGVSRDFLRAEAERSLAGELTPDCRSGVCTNCGACPGPQAVPGGDEVGSGPTPDALAGPGGIPAGAAGASGTSDVQIRHRVKFAKGEDMVFASHLDIVRAIQRGLRRSDMPLCYSKGFSPHPRMSFGPPLPLGVLGESEYLDVFFARAPEDGWTDRVNACLPKGLSLIESRMMARRVSSLMKIINAARYTVVIWKDGVTDAAGLAEQIGERLPAGSEILGMDSEGNDDRISVEIRTSLVSGTSRPEKVFDGVLREAGVCYRIIRNELYNERDGAVRSPFEIQS